MRQALERRLLTIHSIACFEQRRVVSLAVVSDEYVETLKILSQCGEHAFFFRVLAQKELAQRKAFRSDAADTDEKRIRAAAAGKTSGFGIEKCPAFGRNSVQFGLAQYAQEIVRKF